jgi:hypothetical protein
MWRTGRRNKKISKICTAKGKIYDRWQMNYITVLKKLRA